jgi:hypothetical protein
MLQRQLALSLSVWLKAHLIFKGPKCAVSAFGRNGLFPLAAFFTWTHGTVFYLTALVVRSIHGRFQMDVRASRFRVSWSL